MGNIHHALHQTGTHDNVIGVSWRVLPFLLCPLAPGWFVDQDRRGSSGSQVHTACSYKKSKTKLKLEIGLKLSETQERSRTSLPFDVRKGQGLVHNVLIYIRMF